MLLFGTQALSHARRDRVKCCTVTGACAQDVCGEGPCARAVFTYCGGLLILLHLQGLERSGAVLRSCELVMVLTDPYHLAPTTHVHAGDLCHLFTTSRHQQRGVSDQGAAPQAPAPRRHGWGIRSVFSEEQLDCLLASTPPTTRLTSCSITDTSTTAAPTTRDGSDSSRSRGDGCSCVVLRVVASVQHLPLRGADVLGCPYSGGAPLLLACTPMPPGLGPRAEGGASGGNGGAGGGAQEGGGGSAASAGAAGAAGAGVPSAPEGRRGGGGPMGNAVAAAAHSVMRPLTGRGAAAPGPYMPLPPPLALPAMRSVSQLDVLLVGYGWTCGWRPQGTCCLHSQLSRLKGRRCCCCWVEDPRSPCTRGLEHAPYVMPRAACHARAGQPQPPGGAGGGAAAAAAVRRAAGRGGAQAHPQPRVDGWVAGRRWGMGGGALAQVWPYGVQMGKRWTSTLAVA